LRKIDFYADKLCVTPNHLGTFIKKASRLTIMQWLNRHTIQKAKVLLRYMARYRVFP
jgi:YesN/AraC family two-component response regulator